MKHLRTTLLLLLVMGVAAALYFANMETVRSTFCMDTVLHVQLKGYVPEDVVTQGFDLVRGAEKRLSATLPDSHIRTGKIDKSTAGLLRTALSYCEKSKGVYDISIAPLSLLWKGQALPQEKAVEKALALVDYRKISVTDESLNMAEGMAVDLGSAGKGYAADLLAAHLRSNKVKDGIINFGGSITALGEKSVGIQTPYAETQGEYMGLVDVCDLSVVTSGRYERYFTQGEKEYHHMIDLKTGYPMENGILSATVIGEEAMRCDILSTILFLTGDLSLLDEGYGGIILYDDHTYTLTKNIKFTLADETYKER